MPRIRAGQTPPDFPEIRPEPVGLAEAGLATAEPEAPVEAPEPVAAPEPKSATARPKAPLPPASELVADEIERERRLAHCREELVFRRHELLAAGQDLTADEMRILRSAIARGPHESDFSVNERVGQYLHREDRRVERIRTLQAGAGTPADRTAADALAEASRADLESEAPGIEERIAELQSQLGALHRAAAEAKTAADARHAAVHALHDEQLLPAFVLDELRALRRTHEADFGHELRQLELRRTHIPKTLAVDVNTKEGLRVVQLHVEGNHRFGASTFDQLRWMFVCSETNEGTRTAFKVGRLREERWAAYCDELRTELVDVEARIAEIATGVQAEAEEDVRKLKSYYVS